MSNVIDVSKVKDRRVFFDTNIWILLEGYNPGAPQKKVDIYSAAYDSLIKGGNTIVINELVLSEFCHLCSKLAFEDIKRKNPSVQSSFKAFRRKEEFKETMDGIWATAHNILANCDFVSSHSYDIDLALNLFARGTMDFQDVLIAQFCETEKLFLMSDDKDFTRGLNINLITYYF